MKGVNLSLMPSFGNKRWTCKSYWIYPEVMNSTHNIANMKNILFFPDPLFKAVNCYKLQQKFADVTKDYIHYGTKTHSLINFQYTLD